MPWVRFEDVFPLHRKIRRLPDDSFRLHVSGICWSSQYLTDGFIDQDDLDLVADVEDAHSAVKPLEQRHLWEPVPGGWQIHDFLTYQPTAEETREKREAISASRAEAGRKGGIASGESRRSKGSKDEANPKQDARSLASDLLEAHEPPTRPEPNPISSSSSSRASAQRSTLRTAQAATERGSVLLDEHQDALSEDRRPILPRQVLGALGRTIDDLVGQGLDDDAIRGGLRMLRGNPKWAGSANLLPRFAAQCQSQTYAATRAPKGQMWG